MITRNLARERQALFSSPPPSHPPAAATAMEEGGGGCESSSPTSPYSLSKEDMDQLTEEFDRVEEMTTSGRTYEELVSASQQQEEQSDLRNSTISEGTEENEEPSSLQDKRYGRRSMGFMIGRDSLSNWSTVGQGPLDDRGDDRDDGIPSSVDMEQMNTGRKSNVSRLSLGRDSSISETANIVNAIHVNVSHRRSVHVNNSRGSRGQRSNNARLSRPSRVMTSGGRRSNPLNLSHISSSSSSGMDVTGDSMLGESWSPIRTSLENSFAKSLANEMRDNDLRSSIGGKGSGSLSPIPGRTSSSLSPNNPSPEMTNPESVANGTSSTQNKASESRKSVIVANRSGSSSPSRGRNSNGLSLKKLSPVKGKSTSPTKRRSLSPKKSPTKSKSPVRSPVRSPLGDISPNRSPARGRSPKKGALSPKRNNASASMTSPKKKALSPNGTYSLEEAEGTRLSPPTAATSMTEAPGSVSSSNMSVSSGSEATTSSAMIAPQTKEALSGLLSRSEGFEREETKKNAPATERGSAAASQEEISEIMMQSPEKCFAKGHARSPAPTPNSQRRVIKRFRASVPAANYLMPKEQLEESVEKNPNRREDLLENSLERNPNRKPDSVEKSSSLTDPATNIHSGEHVEEIAVASNDSTQLSDAMESEESTEPTASQPVYENAFEFPSYCIPVPRTKTLRLFHVKAVSNGSPSHQYQLNRAGTNLLSLQEVILPAIACEMSAVLKKKQAKAQRNVKDGMPDSQGKEVVEAIETCRKVVKKCTNKAMEVVGEAWRERDKERERLRLENLEKEKEQQRLDKLKAKKERKEARARSRQERYERQKREKQRNHPRNKELWQEVAKLMVDIQKLEKEERLWKEALVEVNRMEEHHQLPEKMGLDTIVEKDKDQLVNIVENADLESAATTLVEDVTMTTERINWMLKSVSLAMEESDKLRKEAYEKYQYDGLKFYGYPQVDDSKGLFMALSMESPLRE